MSYQPPNQVSDSNQISNNQTSPQMASHIKNLQASLKNTRWWWKGVKLALKYKGKG